MWNSLCHYHEVLMSRFIVHLQLQHEAAASHSWTSAARDHKIPYVWPPSKVKKIAGFSSAPVRLRPLNSPPAHERHRPRWSATFGSFNIFFFCPRCFALLFSRCYLSRGINPISPCCSRELLLFSVLLMYCFVSPCVSFTVCVSSAHL
jgi:hypothetical protein